MMKTILHRRPTNKLTRSVLLSLLLIATPFMMNTEASAAVITNRAVALSTSVGDASGVSYTFTSAALPTTGTPVQSVEMQICTTASGTCTTPVGFANGSSTLLSQPSGLGAASGWTVNTGGTGALRISNASNVTNPSGAVSIAWGNVHNPTATNTTFFARLTTYSGSNWATGPLDNGTVALSTSAQIQVTLSVDEALTFCTGTSITGQNCGTVSGSTVSLGTASTTATSSGTSVMAASTNANSGYTITIFGNTLTSGVNTITAMAGTGSSTGTSQYGINLVSNATPSVGANVTGAGSALPTNNYDDADSFRFNSGDVVASAAGPTNANAFTVSYIANISGVTLPGAYTSNLNYVATANF